MGARWYNSSDGDFTSAETVMVSPDPDSAAGNPFAYAADEPLDLVDPTGHYIVPPPNAGTSERIGNGVTSPSNFVADVATARIVEHAVITAPNNAAKAAAAHAALARVEAEHATARRAALAAAKVEARRQAVARAAAAAHAVEMERLEAQEKDDSRLRENGYSTTVTGATNPENVHGGNAVVGAGLIEGGLSIVDGILNSPVQLTHLEDPRIPEAYHVDLEGKFASWADSRLDITPCSPDAIIEGASSIAAQLGLAFIPGAE